MQFAKVIYSISDIIAILIIYQSLMFLFYLLFIKNVKLLFSRALIALCFFMALHFSYMLIEKHYPVGNLFLGPAFGLAYGPLYLIYIRSLIVRQYNYQRFLWHFTPVFLFLTIRLFDFYLVKWITMVVTLHFTCYLVFCLKTIYGYRVQLRNTSSRLDPISLKWLEYILYLQLIVLVITVFESVFKGSEIGEVFIFVIFILVLFLVNCFFFLGLRQIRLFSGFDDEKTVTAAKKYELPDNVSKDFAKQLEEFIQKEKPYLDYDVSLSDISEKLSISKRNLSYVINKEFTNNFYDFINNFRIEEAKELLQNTKKSIKEIMYSSGFSNKSTFHSFFKKNTGITPSQYRKQFKK